MPGQRGESSGVYKKNWKGPEAENEGQREDHSKQREPQSRKPFSVLWQCEHAAPQSPPWMRSGEKQEEEKRSLCLFLFMLFILRILLLVISTSSSAIVSSPSSSLLCSSFFFIFPSPLLAPLYLPLPLNPLPLPNHFLCLNRILHIFPLLPPY